MPAQSPVPARRRPGEVLEREMEAEAPGLLDRQVHDVVAELGGGALDHGGVGQATELVGKGFVDHRLTEHAGAIGRRSPRNNIVMNRP